VCVYVKIMEEQDNKPKCKKCGSGQVYFRIATKELVCRLCGYIDKDERRKKDERRN